jgi:hypothetical protein
MRRVAKLSMAESFYFIIIKDSLRDLYYHDHAEQDDILEHLGHMAISREGNLYTFEDGSKLELTLFPSYPNLWAMPKVIQ